MKEEDRRPDSEQLLRSIQNADGPPGGRLKIFFGYAAGVGKTYAMLEAAHHAKSMGADVVAGYIEPHTRPETQALLEGLEPWQMTTLHDSLMDLAVRLGVKNGTLLWPVRIAAAGMTVTPGGAMEILTLLGKEESLRRLKVGLAKL